MKEESKTTVAPECGDLNELVPLFMAAPVDRRAAAFAALRGEDVRKADDRPGSLRLFKMGEAVSLTGLSRTTLWRAIRDGRVKAVEVRRGSFRVPENELRKLVAVS